MLLLRSGSWRRAAAGGGGCLCRCLRLYLGRLLVHCRLGCAPGSASLALLCPGGSTGRWRRHMHCRRGGDGSRLGPRHSLSRQHSVCACGLQPSNLLPYKLSSVRRMLRSRLVCPPHCPGAPAASRSIRSHRHLIRAKVRGPGDLISSITLCLSENPALRSLQGTGRDRAAYRCACAPFRVRPRGRLCGQTAGGVPPAPPGLVWSVVAQQRLQERPAENPPARHAAEPAGMAGRLC